MKNSFLTLVLLIVVPVISIAVWRFLRFLESQNNVDWGGRGLNRIAGFNRWFCYRYHRLSGDALKLPDEGGALVVSNHVSGLDALVLIAASNRPLRFLIAREQYQRFGFTWLFKAAGCIPVERESRPERAFREALRKLDDGEILALFPHGKIHLDSDPPRRLKGGVVKMAQISGCPVFPVRIDGVKAQGHTVLSVPIRSNVTLKVGHALHCQQRESQQCLQSIAEHIEKSLAAD